MRDADDMVSSGWAGPHAPPLVVDVGCHRGLFLVAMAEANPAVHCLGIEKQAARAAAARRRIARLGLGNAAVLHAEAEAALASLPVRSASQIHVLFPDPWPKRRHAARRMVHPGFLSECMRVLAPDGILRIVTDDQAYASQITGFATACGGLRPVSGDPPVFPPSSFQHTFAAIGKPVVTMLWRAGGDQAADAGDTDF
jgi:tRNA (guanine-N7-)-methyltransferase